MDITRKPIAVQTAPPASGGTRPRNLLAACIVHALHDGYTDGLYAFLAVWQSQFRLSYAGLAVVRTLYYGTMGSLQLPADRTLRGLTPRTALILATLIAAAGFLIMALPLGFSGLCLGLVVAGVGSSIQHPRGSTLVTDTYGVASRRPLGIYNFSGDLGKATLPALAALLLPVMAWRPVVGLMALVGLGVAGIVMMLAPAVTHIDNTQVKRAPASDARGGFALLTVIGGLDTATRTSAADRVADCGVADQWPNERKPIFFIARSVASSNRCRRIGMSEGTPSCCHPDRLVGTGDSIGDNMLKLGKGRLQLSIF